MSGDLTLPGRDDARVIWVFAADLDRTAFTGFATPAETWPLAEALGLPGLSPAAVETLHAEDMAGYGLDRYLIEGHGMDPASVAPDAPMLDSLTGPIVLLFSRHLPPDAREIDPRPPLAFVGRYDAPWHLVPSLPHRPSESTSGLIAGPAGPGENRRALRRGLLVTLAVLVGLALVVAVLA